MQEQINTVNDTLDKHDNRLIFLERVIWVMLGVSIDNLDSLPFIQSFF